MLLLYFGAVSENAYYLRLGRYVSVDEGNAAHFLYLCPAAYGRDLEPQRVAGDDGAAKSAIVDAGKQRYLVITILKLAKPDVRMVLELITRDPLKVTCLTDKFWATMPHVSGSDLARTLRFVREHPATTLQEVSSLSLEKQVELEDANIAASLKYARNELGM